MKTLKSLFLLATQVLFITFIATGAHYQSAQMDKENESIKTLLVNRDKEIKKLLGPEGSTYDDAQKEKLKSIINGIVDYEAMAKLALEQYYDSVEEAKRKEFVQLFAEIIRDQSLNKLDIYRAEVVYTSISVNGDSAMVETMATLKDVRTPVSYTMFKQKGEWVITDMIIDNVSTAKSYRRSFQTHIKKKGFDSLLASLRKRADRN